MWLLDTCALSDLAERRDEGLTAWAVATPASTLHLSVISVGEIQRGIEMLADGTRRWALQRWLRHGLTTGEFGRVLDVSADVALQWGVLLAEARRRSRPLAALDAYIVATAQVHGLTVVTRGADFTDRGVPVLNPWGGRAR